MSSLGEQLRQIAGRTHESLESAVCKTVLDMSRQLIREESPVDTGRFRNNWQFGLDAINYDTSAPAQKNGDDAIGRIEVGIKSWKPGQTIYITNSLPYAQRLEHGWSKQAPKGMVKVTFDHFEETFSRALGEAKS